MKDVAQSRWETKPLGEVCKFIGGGTPSKQNPAFWGGNFPWVSPKDMKSEIVSDSIDHVTESAIEQSAAKRIPEGSLLIVVRSGILARTIPIAIAGRELTVNQDLKAMVPDKGLDRHFLAYFLRSAEGQLLDRVTRGATVHKLDMPLIKSLPIPFPPLEEQRRIVAVLDEAFEGLARARAHTEANLQNARELFESLRFAMLSERTEGWEVHRLGDCFRLKSGDNLTAKKMVAGRFPVYGGNGIAGTHNESNLSGDNVIIGRVGALCGNARYIDQDIWLTDNAFKVVNYSFPFDCKFLTYLLNFKNLRSLARQAAQPVISNSSLADLELKFPASVELQAELASKLAAAEMELEVVQTKYEAKIQGLDDLRQSLLQKAFAGELTKGN
ncbi:MAG: restriction endonuclease subunit S [Rhodobacteraceae bacterium]|nr:restriction endonuclease subunit S [Paracoccaceae bacterium]